MGLRRRRGGDHQLGDAEAPSFCSTNRFGSSTAFGLAFRIFRRRVGGRCSEPAAADRNLDFLTSGLLTLMIIRRFPRNNGSRLVLCRRILILEQMGDLTQTEFRWCRTYSIVFILRKS